MGSGKDELAECLFGIVRPDGGSIWLDGQEVHITTTAKAAQLGIAYVPPNRQDTLFPINEIYKNITIAHLKQLCSRLVRRSQEVEISQRQMNTLGVYPPNPTMGVGNLSGGNQQKVVLAKWLTVLPKVLMLNDPTRGMDVGAKKEVMDIIENLRDKGVATLLLSQEPELLMAYADRVIVLHRGHQVAEIQNEELTKEGLLAYS
jgi:ribose transport system ATP-binding protein